MPRLKHLAIACGVLLAVTGCTTASTPEPPASAVTPTPTVADGSVLERIKSRGTVIVGVKYDVPLFGLNDPAAGTITGFDIEIAQIAARRIFDLAAGSPVRDRITFVEAISKNREEFLQSGTVDLVISTYTITESRKQLVDFAGPYYIAGQDVLAKSTDIESGRISGVADLNGKKVCAVSGSTSLNNLLAAAPNADTSVTKERYSECFAALQRGLVEAMSTDDVILLGLSGESKGTFSILGNPFHTEPYGVGVAKGEDALRSLINDALQQAFDDGSWGAAFEQTVGTVGAATPFPPTLDP